MKEKIFNLFKKEHLHFLKFAHEHRIQINPKLRYVGIIFITFAYFLLANSTIFFEKVSESIPIFQIFFIQFLTVFIVYILFLLPKGFKIFKPKETKLVLFRGTIAMITYYAYFASKIWIDVIDNSLLFSIDSLVIPLIMYIFFGVFIGRTAVIGLLIGFLGICFVNVFDFKFYSWGGVIGILSGIGLAFIVVITSYMVKKDSPLVIAFYQSLIGVISAGVLMCFTGWKNLDLINLTSIICQAAFFAVALFLFLDAFYYTEAYIIGALGYTLTVFIIFLEALILGKVVDLYSLVGTVLVCGGGLTVITNGYYRDKHLTQDKN
jgi:drug/metabolite transporter (DMT)-like permease